MNKVYAAIGALTNYAISHGLAEEADRHYLVNALLEKLGLDDYETVGDVPFQGLDDILDTLVDYAAEQGLLKSESITGRDLFDTALMGVVTPRPSEVIRTFRSLYGESPEKATDWFYRFSQDTNYIRATRVAKDIRWSVPSEFGDIDISINLSKPEKDPRDIAAAKTAKQSAYPKCQLCLENEGYAGRMDHPARQNHRIIPVTINESHWGFQYSPYVYYNEHCIVLNGEHVPMKIDRAAFRKLFDFVGQFPHYFLGSNADLPIVGGSILSHDHFQGGRYEFAMAKAPYESKFTVPGYEDVEAGIVHWPLSVIRLRGEDDERIIDLADHILQAWRGYTDEDAFVFAETDGEDLALRNNITTDECPLGVYHPHAEYHHIKKENIGLIEVMGLAILPARLKTEMALLAECLTGENDLADYPELEQHAEWAKDIAARRTDLSKDNVDDILKEEIGHVFVHVLEDAGVYKCTDEGRAAFRRFIATL